MSHFSLAGLRKARHDIGRVVDLFTPGPSRRAGRFDVYRAYMTHLPSIIPRCANAVLGTKPVRRDVTIPSPRSLTYRPGTSDLRVFKQVMVGAEYESDGLVKDPASVEYILDLGSNIGVTTLLWSQMYPNAKVFCVEPDEENFSILESNLAQFKGRCSAMRAAVCDHDGTIDFFRSSSIFFWSSSTDPAIAKGAVKKITVPAATMSTIIARSGFPRIDMVKMDIEGGERSVLPGAKDWPMKPKFLVAELHDPYRFEHFARDCETAGYQAFHSGPSRKMEWAVLKD
jgi:FkbM family methyltransferase